MSVDHQAPFGVSYPMDGASCPSVSLCVAGGGSGVIEFSKNPSGGARTWRGAVVDRASDQDGPGTINAVSCPSVSFCVAVDNHGHVLVSRDPTGGAKAWSVSASPAAAGLLAISCPSAHLCVAIDGGGELMRSRAPAGGKRTWRVGPTKPGLASVSCPSVSMCVAGGYEHAAAPFLVVSSKPAGDASAWRTVTLSALYRVGLGVPGAGLLVSCPTTTRCVAALGWFILSTSEPLGPASGWRASYQLAFSGDGFVGISCTTTEVCAAVSLQGAVVSSSDPAAGQSAWVKQSLPDVTQPGLVGNEMACGPRVCVAAASDQIITATAATDASVSWRAGLLPAGYNAFEQVVCPSASECLAIDDAGSVVSTRDATASRPVWRIAHIDPAPPAGTEITVGLRQLSCPSVNLCVVGDDAGRLISSTDPTGPSSAWHAGGLLNLDSDLAGLPPSDLYDITPLTDFPFRSLTCPSTRLCVALGASAVEVSSTPAAPSSWKAAKLPETELPIGAPFATSNGSLPSIACPTVSLCVGIDTNGYAISSTDPAGGSAWTAVPVDVPQPAETDQSTNQTYIACASASLCVSEDGEGQNGTIVSSTQPTTSHWNRFVPTSADAIPAVDLQCPNGRLCLGLPVEPDADIISSTNPLSTARTAWHTEQLLGLGNPIAGVSCASATLCTAYDQNGRIATSTNPTGGSTAWSGRKVFNSAAIGVDCATARRCVAADSSGQVSIGTLTAPPARR
jgi:hypothetical protein